MRRANDFNVHWLDNIDTEEKAYFLGFVYADGSHRPERHSLHITLQNEDEEILRKFYELLDYNKPMIKYLNKQVQKYYSHFRVQSKYFSNRLTELGVFQNKAFKIKFPNWLNENLYSHFIRGYIDGDGCIFAPDNISKSMVSICGNYDFLSSVSKIIFEQTGVQLRLYPNNHSDVYILQSGGRVRVEKILNWLYNDSHIFLKRKYNKYQKIKKYNEINRPRRTSVA